MVEVDKNLNNHYNIYEKTIELRQNTWQTHMGSE